MPRGPEPARRFGQVRGSDADLLAFAEALPALTSAAPARRVEIDPAQVERGLTQLVLSLVELLRRLLEKQALRRIEGGSLSPAQVEQLGDTLARLCAQMRSLQDHFQIEDLNISLGPLGDLLD